MTWLLQWCWIYQLKCLVYSGLEHSTGTGCKSCMPVVANMNLITGILDWIWRQSLKHLDSIKIWSADFSTTFFFPNLSIIETHNNENTVHLVASFQTLYWTSQIPSAKSSSPRPIVSVSVCSELLLVASPCPQPHAHTLCNLNLIFNLFGIPRTTLFGHNLLPRQRLIRAGLYWSFTSAGMKNYFCVQHLWLRGAIYRIPFPIETLSFTLLESSVDSSVSLIWDFCHLLSFRQASKKPSQCSVMSCYTLLVNRVWKPWNSIIWVADRLLWPSLKRPDQCALSSSTRPLIQKRLEWGRVLHKSNAEFITKSLWNIGCVSTTLKRHVDFWNRFIPQGTH